MPIRLIGCKLALLGARRFQRLLSDSISARLGKFTVESFLRRSLGLFTFYGCS